MLQQWVSRQLSVPAPGEAPTGFVASSLGGDLIGLRGEVRNSSVGGYILRRGPSCPVIVQAPHIFFDRHTLPIAKGLFEGLGATALLFNTSHRYRGSNCPAPTEDAAPSRTCASDVAHSDKSFFHAVHEALIAHQSDRLTVAIHGFAERKGDPDVIVSSAGTRTDAPCVAKRLREVHRIHALAYPEEVSRLGGTTGAQAASVRAAGGQMVHLEISRQRRDRGPDTTVSAFAEAIAACFLNERDTCGAALIAAAEQ